MISSIGKNGIALIKKWEGVRLEAYIPVKGDVPTIGYGSTLGVKMGDKISAERAEELLREDLVRFEACISNSVLVALNQNQFDACVSLAFNIGEGNFKKSTLLRILNANNIRGAADQFLVWRMAGGRVLKGLENRRRDEKELFLT